MKRDPIPEDEGHHHGGKSSESLLDKELILKALDIQPGQNVLDAGCGDGYMSKEFSKAVIPSGKVYALDPYRESIERLKEETAGTHIEAMEGDITRQTPLEPSSMDLIYLSTVIHGFSEERMQGFIQESLRLLKPGGRLAIVEIEKKETPFGPPLNIRISPEELKSLIPLAPLSTESAGEHFYLQIFKNA